MKNVTNERQRKFMIFNASLLTTVSVKSFFSLIKFIQIYTKSTKFRSKGINKKNNLFKPSQINKIEYKLTEKEKNKNQKQKHFSSVLDMSKNAMTNKL